MKSKPTPKAKPKKAKEHRIYISGPFIYRSFQRELHSAIGNGSEAHEAEVFGKMLKDGYVTRTKWDADSPATYEMSKAYTFTI